MLRKRLEGKLKGFNSRNLFICATHTHTAPSIRNQGNPPDSVMKGSEYREFLLDRVEKAVTGAWNNRRFGGISRAQGTAAVGFCRIAVYKDGKAQMYGNTLKPEFKDGIRS